jgi:hypothetical protein
MLNFQRLSRFALAGLLSLSVTGITGCEPTPSFLQQWANTPDSEERFAEYLKDPSVSHEVRVTALELLIRQWQYSAPMFAGGQVLREMPDPAERDAVIRDVVPFLSAYVRDASTSSRGRDAVMAIREGTDDAAVLGQLNAILLEFINNQWTPCLQSSGSTSAQTILSALPEAEAAPRVAAVFREGETSDVICFVTNITNVSWLNQSSTVAEAYMERYNSGNIPEGDQARFDYIQYSLKMIEQPVIREFYFSRIANLETDPLHRNFMLDALAQNPVENEQERYLALLEVPLTVRWAAVQTIVQRDGSQGLEAVLSNLPANGEFRIYQGSVQEDGFKQSAENIVCAITKLGELGDFARQTFERHIEDENLNARALSLSCLERFGNAQTAERLRAWADGLGAESVPTPPGYAGLSFQELAQETIEAIAARLSGGQQPGK